MTTIDDATDQARLRPSTRSTGQRLMPWLVVVAVAYFLLQVLLSGVTRFVSYDEAVYLTEVQRGATGVAFAAHRSRGASWLVWPTAALGAPVLVTRLWLAGLSSLGLFLAFRTWVRTVGDGAVWAAGLFAGCWVAILFGNEIESNLFAALAVVAAVGLGVQPPSPRRRGLQLLGIGTAMALLAVFRPTDVAWAGLTLLVCLPLLHGWRGFMAVVAAGVGSVIGWVPWIVEAVLRFQGPVHRFEMMSNSTVGAGGVEGAGLWLRIRQYLSLADAPRALTSGSPESAFLEPSVSVVVWLGVVVVALIVAAGTLWPRATSHAGAVRTAAFGGMVFLAAYVLLTGYVHIRFLLPAWGLAAVPAAETLLRVRGLPRRALGTGLVTALLAVWMTGQFVTLREEAGGLVDYRNDVRTLGTTVERMVEHPCYVYSEREYPTIALTSGCRTESFTPGDDRPVRTDPEELADDGLHVYGLTREPGPPLSDWPSTPIPGQDDGWRLYERPSQSG